MAQKSPWSVKGIDERAREAAREAARQEGMTLGQYLNRLILDGEDDDIADDWQQAPRGFEPANSSILRKSDTLDALAKRIEATEARSTLAITGIDQSVAGLVARIDDLQRNTQSVALQLDGSTDDLRATQAALKERLETLEGDDTNHRNLAALKSLENALGKLANHVYDENSRVQAANDELKAELFQVDEKVENLSGQIDNTLSEAADRVSRAVEDAELRAEGAVKHVADRLSNVETAVAERLGTTDKTVSSVRADMDGLKEDMTGAIERVGNSVDTIYDKVAETSGAMESIEGSVARITERLNRAETTTDSAIQALESSFLSLDERLSAIDPNAAEQFQTAMDERLNSMADDLAASVIKMREEIAQQLETTANAVDNDAFDEVTNALVEMNKRMRAAEEKQSRAVEAIGDEVAKVITTLDKRLKNVESRPAGAAGQDVREQIETLTSAFETRLEKIEAREAGAIEKVGDEVSEIASKLDKRIAESEQRSAGAIEQIGDQLVSATGRLQKRQEDGLKQISDQLAKQDAEQTKRIDSALGDVKRQIKSVEDSANAAISPIQKAMTSLAERLDSIEDFTTPPDVPRTSASADANFDIPKISSGAAVNEFAELPSIDDDELAPQIGPSGRDRDMADRPNFDLPADWDNDDEATFVTPDVAINDDQPDPDETLIADLPDDEFDFADTDFDAEDDDTPPARFELDEDDSDDGADDYLSRARRAALSAATAGGRDAPKAAFASNQKSSGSKLPIAAAAGALAIAAVAGGGYMLMRGKQDVPAESYTSLTADEGYETASELGDDESFIVDFDDAVAIEATEDAAEVTEDTPEPEAVVEPVSSSDEAALEDDDLFEITFEEFTVSDASNAVTERAAPSSTVTEPEAERTITIANLQPTVEETAPARPATVAPAAPVITVEMAAARGNKYAQYEVAKAKLNEGDFSLAASLMKKAANQDVAVAQYRLAKMYERGQGLPRDLGQAREWTEDAAEAGNVKAMHDLAVFYAEGEGGAQSYAAAVEWFRKAAEHGLVDSQYNLGILYEQGLGVSPNLSEALYWFEVANRYGDPGAPDKIREIGLKISPSATAATAARAAQFKAVAADNEANGRFPQQSWAKNDQAAIQEVQLMLNRLGFTAGQPDGVMGSSTRSAIIEYQRSKGLSQTGQVSETLIRSLSDSISSSAG